MYTVIFTRAGEEMRRWTGYATRGEARAAIRDADMIIPLSWSWIIAAE
jgi:hypothetical protein